MHLLQHDAHPVVGAEGNVEKILAARFRLHLEMCAWGHCAECHRGRQILRYRRKGLDKRRKASIATTIAHARAMFNGWRSYEYLLLSVGFSAKIMSRLGSGLFDSTPLKVRLPRA